MVNWNKYTEDGKAEKEALQNENLDMAFKGLSVVLDDLFEDPELSIMDRTRLADHLRSALEAFKAGGARLSLGSSTPAPAEETTEQPEQQPQSSTPADISAAESRVRELESTLPNLISDAGGTPVWGIDGKLDLGASFASVKRANEKKVDEAKLPKDGSVKKEDIRKALEGLAATMGDGFRNSRIGNDKLVISTEDYNKMVAEIRKIEAQVS